jgi:hypothetical protein
MLPERRKYFIDHQEVLAYGPLSAEYDSCISSPTI